MSPELLPRIFDPFVRGDASRSYRGEGAGLGLSLVKWIVDRHHGRIDVHSTQGKGSIFTVQLPLH
jgi:signal transduction histidine kinase